MITDHIANKNLYCSHPLIHEALHLLSGYEPDAPLPEVIEVDPISGLDRANPVSFISKPCEECRFEAHRKFIDVHYSVSGIEVIESTTYQGLKIEISYDEQKDIEIYDRSPEYVDRFDFCHYTSKTVLGPGAFAIYFPGDIHMPAIMADGPAEVRKIVIKISIDDYLESV
jgi:YhcH/YjgK/YiaL family protein